MPAMLPKRMSFVALLSFFCSALDFPVDSSKTSSFGAYTFHERAGGPEAGTGGLIACLVLHEGRVDDVDARVAVLP